MESFQTQQDELHSPTEPFSSGCSRCCALHVTVWSPTTQDRQGKSLFSKNFLRGRPWVGGDEGYFFYSRVFFLCLLLAWDIARCSPVVRCIVSQASPLWRCPRVIARDDYAPCLRRHPPLAADIIKVTRLFSHQAPCCCALSLTSSLAFTLVSTLPLCACINHVDPFHIALGHPTSRRIPPQGASHRRERRHGARCLSSSMHPSRGRTHFVTSPVLITILRTAAAAAADDEFITVSRVVSLL